MRGSPARINIIHFEKFGELALAQATNNSYNFITVTHGVNSEPGTSGNQAEDFDKMTSCPGREPPLVPPGLAPPLAQPSKARASPARPPGLVQSRATRRRCCLRQASAWPRYNPLWKPQEELIESFINTLDRILNRDSIMSLQPLWSSRSPI